VASEAVDVVLDQYAATNERDFERAMAHYADDVELIAREPWIYTGVFKGRDAVGAFFGDWLATFDRDAKFEIIEVRELPTGEVLIVADHHARGRASGAEVHGTVVWMIRVAHGKISRVEGFPTREAALEARGLSE
jgi:ketosteroid isomerase-like protein